MRRKLKFRMQGILSIRKYEETQKRMVLRQTAQDLRNIAHATEEIEEEKLRVSKKGDFDFLEYQMRGNYVASLNRKKQALKAEEHVAHEKFLEAEQGYYDAKGRRRALEVLKERQRLRQMKKESHQAQIHIDDGGTRYWIRHHL